MEFIKAFAVREFQRIWNHKGFLFLVSGFPLVLGIIFGRVYSERVISDLPMVVLDEDHSQLSRTIIRYVDATRGLNIVKNVASAEAIENLLINGEIAGGLVIPRHLERNIKRGEAQSVLAFINASNLSFANQTNTDLRSVIGTIAAGIQLKYLQKAGSSSIRAMAQIQSLTIEVARLYNPGFNYQNYVVPGLWASVLFQLLVIFGGLALVREFEMGRGPELWQLAEGKAWKLLCGKLVPYMLIGTLLFASYFFGIFPLFDIPLQGSPLILLLFSSLLVLAALSYGLALSSSAKDAAGMMRSVLVITGPAFSLSGYIWPAEVTPQVLRWLAQIFPLTPYLSGYRKLFQEGADPTMLWPEVGHLLLLALLGLFAAYRGLQKKKVAML